MSFLNRLRPISLIRKKTPLPRGQSLALRPLRNPEIQWEPKKNTALDSDTEALVLTLPRPTDIVATTILRVFRVSGSRTVELDEFGSEIWLLCDGTHRVEQLVTQTSQKYKLNRRQAEVSVLTFMRMLSQRRLIGFIAEDLASKPSAARPKSKKKPRRY